MKKNNAGFSLVEIIVVVAMLSILIVAGGYGINQIGGFWAREAADKINSSLTENKIQTLGKAKAPGEMAWEIYCDGTNYFVRTVSGIGSGSSGSSTEKYSNLEQINEGRIEVYIDENNNDSMEADELLEDGENYRVYFNRSTGALCDALGAGLADNCVFVVKQGKKTYEIEVISKTGKVISNSRK